MNKDAILQLLEVANDAELGESGGSHNQKGVDFQRYWTINRILELESSGAEDFLLLIEAIQDVAELDSSTNPSSICVYQVKKKDRSEWSWNQLTKNKKPSSRGSANPEEFKKSPIGKLYATFITFTDLKISGRFISNHGCDLPLANGDNAATSLPTSLNELSEEYKLLLREAMVELDTEEQADYALENIYVEKVSIPADDPRTHLVGCAHNFLEKRSAKHAGQARSLVDALMAIIGPLGAKTNSCSTFEELCKQHGYKRDQFSSALSDLESTPDIQDHLESWLRILEKEGMNILDVTAIRAEAAAIYRRNIMRVPEPEPSLIVACDNFLNLNKISGELLQTFELAYRELREKYEGLKKSQILAQLALRAIKRCVDQI